MYQTVKNILFLLKLFFMNLVLKTIKIGKCMTVLKLNNFLLEQLNSYSYYFKFNFHYITLNF